MLLNRLYEKKLIHPPSWLPSNTHLLARIGGKMYGYSDEDGDEDILGICIPPRDMVFPTGEILGFGRQKKHFEQYEEQRIEDKEARKQYDLSIYSIVKFFDLAMENNPNFLTALFVPINHILHITRIGTIIRDNRRMFLHKGCYWKYKGYAYSMVAKLKNKNPGPDSKRYELIKKYKYDVKYALHLVRLLNEVQQILIEGDLNVHKNLEQLKSIKRGEWKEEEVLEYFNKKEKELETLYATSSLPYGPDEDKIKSLLLQCLEEHYGNLSSVIVLPDRYKQAVDQIQEICEKLRNNQ
jgi:predicted nucleotidyltransferase